MRRASSLLGPCYTSTRSQFKDAAIRVAASLALQGDKGIVLRCTCRRYRYLLDGYVYIRRFVLSRSCAVFFFLPRYIFSLSRCADHIHLMAGRGDGSPLTNPGHGKVWMDHGKILNCMAQTTEIRKATSTKLPSIYQDFSLARSTQKHARATFYFNPPVGDHEGAKVASGPVCWS